MARIRSQNNLIRKGMACTVLHSNRTQSPASARNWRNLKAESSAVLVATDIAARGIDVDGISHVINFDTPRFAEDYVPSYRENRRASALGDCIDVCLERRTRVHAKNRKIHQPAYGPQTVSVLIIPWRPMTDARFVDEPRHGEGKSRSYHTERKSRPYHAEGKIILALCGRKAPVRAYRGNRPRTMRKGEPV